MTNPAVRPAYAPRGAHVLDGPRCARCTSHPCLAHCWCCGDRVCARCSTYVQVPRRNWVLGGGNPERPAQRRRRRVCRACWPPPWLRNPSQSS